MVASKAFVPAIHHSAMHLRQGDGGSPQIQTGHGYIAPVRMATSTF